MEQPQPKDPRDCLIDDAQMAELFCRGIGRVLMPTPGSGRDSDDLIQRVCWKCICRLANSELPTTSCKVIVLPPGVWQQWLGHQICPGVTPLGQVQERQRCSWYFFFFLPSVQLSDVTAGKKQKKRIRRKIMSLCANMCEIYQGWIVSTTLSDSVFQFSGRPIKSN